MLRTLGSILLGFLLLFLWAVVGLAITGFAVFVVWLTHTKNPVDLFMVGAGAGGCYYGWVRPNTGKEVKQVLWYFVSVCVALLVCIPIAKGLRLILPQHFPYPKLAPPRPSDLRFLGDLVAWGMGGTITILLFAHLAGLPGPGETQKLRGASLISYDEAKTLAETQHREQSGKGQKRP